MGTQSPLSQFLQEANEETAYTYDAPWLFQKKSHLVFEYGTMKIGMPEYDEIKDDAIHMGQAFTVSPYFRLVKRSNGSASFPIAFNSVFASDRAQIRGELFRIRTPKIITLDELRTNGLHYARVRVPVYMPFKYHRDDGISSGAFNLRTYEAWMYVALPTYRQDLLSKPSLYGVCQKHVMPGSPKPQFVFSKGDLK